MASRNGRSNRVWDAVVAVIVSIMAITIVVQSGAWDKFVAVTGIGESVSGVAGLKPQASDYASNGLKVKIPTPSASASASATSGGSASAAGDGSFIEAARSSVSMSQALADAKALTVAAAHPSGYSRESEFGTWINSDQLCGDGTTRDYILKRDLTDVTMSSRCKVQSGTFADPYTGTTMQFKYGKTTSSEIQIDHVVALKDAWASGLYKATQSQRVAYANDPFVLLASNGEQNELKSDGLDYTASSDPIWLPANKAWRCDYIAKRTEIKRKYSLTVTKAEQAQSVSILTACAADTAK